MIYRTLRTAIGSSFHLADRIHSIKRTIGQKHIKLTVLKVKITLHSSNDCMRRLSYVNIQLVFKNFL
jgi:hypothetical protein